MKIGDNVVDTLTGFAGIAYAICEYLDGTTAVGILPIRVKADGGMPEVEWRTAKFVQVVTTDD